MKKKFYGISVFCIIMALLIMSGCDTKVNKTEKQDEKITVRLHLSDHSVFYFPVYALVEGKNKTQFDYKLSCTKTEKNEHENSSEKQEKNGTGQIDLYFVDCKSFMEKLNTADELYMLGSFFDRYPVMVEMPNMTKKPELENLKSKRLLLMEEDFCMEMFSHIMELHQINMDDLCFIHDKSILQGEIADKMTCPVCRVFTDTEEAFAGEKTDTDSKGYLFLSNFSGKIPYIVVLYEKTEDIGEKEMELLKNELEQGMEQAYNMDDNKASKIAGKYFNNIQADDFLMLVRKYRDVKAWPEKLMFSKMQFLILENIWKDNGSECGTFDFHKLRLLPND